MALGDKITVWDAETGKSRITLRDPDTPIGEICDIACSPDGQHVASVGADCRLRVWKTETGELLTCHAAHTKPIRAVAFNQIGNLIATAGDDRKVRVWPATVPFEEQPKNEFTDKYCVYSVAFGPDGNTVTTGGGDRGREVGTVTLWDMTNFSRESITHLVPRSSQLGRI